MSNSSSGAGGAGLLRFGLGPAIIFAAAWLIFWNEGGAARTQSRLTEGARSVVEAQPDRIDPANEGKLIHVMGEVRTEETLHDPVLHIDLPAIKLERVVETYQWTETEQRQDAPPSADGKPVPQIVTYKYEKDWHREWRDSAKFKEPKGHTNPPALLLKGDHWEAKRVTLGAFELTPQQVAKLSANTPVKLTGELGQVALASEQGRVYRSEEHIYVRPAMNQVEFSQAASPPEAVPSDVVANPEVGDIRIKYAAALPREVSVIGQQKGREIVPYESKAGGKIESFLTGRHSAESVFQSAQVWSGRGTWFFRAVSLAIVYVGLFITLGPFTYWAASIAWLRPVVQTGMFYVRAGLTIAITALLVGAAWFYYRPAYAIALFVVGGLFLVGTIWIVWRLSKSAR